MNEKGREPKKIIALIITGCLLMSFLFPFLKHDVLTSLHGNEFEGLYMQTSMISHDDVDSLRVLSYSNNSARIYYVGVTSGNVLEFSRNDDAWELVSWNTMWSSDGSAGEFIWPYFYHSVEGILFFIVLIIFAFITICLYLFAVYVVKTKKQVNRSKSISSGS